jgi:predicted dehydrogenase
MKKRLGFAGLGWIGAHRMKAVIQDGSAEVVACADPDPQARTRVNEVAPDAAFVTRFEDLLDHDLDAVVIATPSALHATQAISALERGLAVFCQKPLARTAAEMREIVEAARKNDRLLGVDFGYRHTQALRAVHELARSGEIGEVYAADLVFHNAYGPDKPWFYDPMLSGGGCVIDLGIHLVDTALWLFGFPTLERCHSRLYASGRPLPPSPVVTEDHAIAELDLAGGRTVRLTCSWNLPAGVDCVIEASLWGTAGALVMRNIGGSFHDFAVWRNRGTAAEQIVAPPDEWGGRAIVAWTRRLADDPRFDPEASRLVDVAAAVDRIYGRDPRSILPAPVPPATASVA